MQTHVPAAGALDSSIVRAASRLLIAGTLLALFSACAGLETDETDLDLDDDEAMQDDDVGAPSDSEEIGTQQQALFGNDCRNADIRVVNSLDYAITVKSVEYWNASEGEWRTEDLANRSVSPTAMEFWMPNLNGAENDWIYSFNVNYECHGSHNHSYHINTPDTTCIPGRVFLLEVD